MVKVAFNITDDYCTFTAQGHAEYDNTGKDIVCAAVSTLSTTLVNSLIGYGYELDAKVVSGDVYVRFDLDQRSGIVADTIRVGFEGLAGSYPDNVMLL